MKTFILLFALATVALAGQSAFADETAVAVTPNPVSLGSGLASELQATVQVTNNTGDTIDITSVTVGGPFLVTGTTPQTLASGASASFTASVAGGTPPGSYADSLVVGYTDETTSDQLTVSDPITATVTRPVQFTTPATVSLARFYPLVVDGYRDSVTYTAHLSERANVVVRVVNARGVVRKSWTLTNVQNPSVLWRGLNLNHRKVDPGSYRFQTFAKVPGFAKVKGGVVAVKVATGFVLVKHRVRAYVRPSVVARSGCINHPYQHGWLINCHGSSSGGTITLRHRYPRNARPKSLSFTIYFYGSAHFVSGHRAGDVGTVVVGVRSGSAALFTVVDWKWSTRRRI